MGKNIGFSRRLSHLLGEKRIRQIEIAREIGVSPQTVNKYLNGSIPGPETLILLCEALNVSIDYMFKGETDDNPIIRVGDDISVPLLGYIPAGPFSEAIKNHLDDVNVSEHLLSGGGDFYALTVEGESMINAGIKPGATAILKHQTTAESGDIVALIVGGEASLKKLFIFDEYLLIQAANPMYPQVTIPKSEAKHVHIAGKLLLVITQFE